MLQMPPPSIHPRCVIISAAVKETPSLRSPTSLCRLSFLGSGEGGIPAVTAGTDPYLGSYEVAAAGGIPRAGIDQ